MHISTYEEGTHYNHLPLKDRKLLLSKRELKKLIKELKNVGLTIIPTRLFISDKGYAKLNIALAKGKKTFDKRDDIKEKDIKRDMERSLWEERREKRGNWDGYRKVKAESFSMPNV